jgi:hypothetical protein
MLVHMGPGFLGLTGIYYVAYGVTIVYIFVESDFTLICFTTACSLLIDPSKQKRSLCCQNQYLLADSVLFVVDLAI